MKRKEIILKRIKEALHLLLELQAENGCFFYPYSNGKTNYCNARWQEAVITIALSLKHKWINDKDAIKKINNGINFLIKLQNNDGSFPEYSRKDKSFAATAFIAFALTKTIDVLKELKINIKEEWNYSLYCALKWLQKENELIYYNQEAAAGASLIIGARIFRNKNFEESGLKKIKKVLNAQKEYYPEKNGFDLAYSSLTLEYLGFVFEEGIMQKDIIDSVEEYYSFLISKDLNNVKNSRNTDWIILDGFEIFAKKVENGKEVLKKVLNLSIQLDHLENQSNICTDMYRLIFAYEHSTELQNKSMNFYKLKPKNYTGTHKKIFNPLRRVGLHRLRNLKLKFSN
ncbi:MAG TPA: hypothetical protein VJG30_02315 [Candidatus Nanoarchaeia archaeon]|nr:hypothetical protein [Candidatus Nanoarchaeia archaeon]